MNNSIEPYIDWHCVSCGYEHETTNEPFSDWPIFECPVCSGHQIARAYKMLPFNEMKVKEDTGHVIFYSAELNAAGLRYGGRVKIPDPLLIPESGLWIKEGYDPLLTFDFFAEQVCGVENLEFSIRIEKELADEMTASKLLASMKAFESVSRQNIIINSMKDLKREKAFLFFKEAHLNSKSKSLNSK